MMDAILRLVQDGGSCCRFHELITDPPVEPIEDSEHDIEAIDLGDIGEQLNASQKLAVKSTIDSPLTLIWGPPG